MDSVHYKVQTERTVFIKPAVSQSILPRILLTVDKSNANFGDRSLLKNLGHWLGLMLLARNKPILMVDLDMKQLIIEVRATRLYLLFTFYIVFILFTYALVGVLCTVYTDVLL